MDPKQLLHYAQDTSSAGRIRLAKAVSHFFEDSTLNESEQALAGEILMNLVRQAETDLREALAERLGVQEKVPQEVMVFLANDEISVAKNVLMHSPLLQEKDLIYIISSKGTAHWQAIAQRRDISPGVASRLADTNDPSTLLQLIDNQRTHLEKSTLKKIVRAAILSEELQAPLLRRPEVDAEIATDLYMVVSDALRREITARYSVPAYVVERTLETLVQELSQAAQGAREATPEMLAIARKMKARGEITADQMIKVLRRGQMAYFVALFSERANVPPQHVLNMIQRDGGKAFVVACRSIGMMKSEFASIFLLSRGIRTGDKIVDQRELAMALKQYDALKDHDAERLLQGWVRSQSASVHA